MQVALEVNNSTSDQAPSTTTEQTNSIQQTGGSEGLGAPSQPQTTTSAADQQQLMELLHAEAAGQPYNAPDSSSVGHVAIQLGAGLAIIILVVVLAVICQQQLEKMYHSAQPKRAAQKKRKK